MTSVESKAFGLELGLRVRHGHLVLFADRHRRIFLPVFQQHEAAVRPKRAPQMPQHDLRMLELVIDVHHQLEIHGAPSGNFGLSGSPSTVMMLARPSFFARASMRASISGWMSTAYTRPDGPTARESFSLM